MRAYYRRGNILEKVLGWKAAVLAAMLQKDQKVVKTVTLRVLFYCIYCKFLYLCLAEAKSKSGQLAHTGSDRSRPAESLTDSSVAGNIEWNTEHDGLFLSELLPNEKSFDTERSEC